MPIKVFLGLFIFLLCITEQSWALDKTYQEQWGKRLEQVTQNFLMLNSIGNINRREKIEFPTFQKEEIDNFLKTEFGELYAGYHPDIALYVKYMCNRPKFQLQLWHTIANQFEKEHATRKGNVVAQLINSRLEFPQYSTNDSWLIPHIISLSYGNQASDFVDNRLQVFSNYLFRLTYFDHLKEQKIKPIHALAFCVLGSSTVTRIPNYEKENYWALYPNLNSDERDFYAAMLASAFVLNEIKKMEIPVFSFEPKNKYISAQSKYALHLEYLAKTFKFPLDELKLMNRKLYSLVVPVRTNFRLPAQFNQQFIAQENTLALGSAYFIHKIKEPFCLVQYTVKSNDNIDLVAKHFSTTAKDIRKINYLNASEWLQDKVLFIQVPLKDSVFYSAFDTLTHQQIQEQIKIMQEANSNWPENCTPAPVKPAQKTHVVKSGETLSHIARKYGVSVNQIKSWNNLRSDNIQIGQKLIIKK